VPLYQHVMVGRRMLDLFASSDVDAAAGFVKEGAPVNGELMKIARDDWASTRLMRDRRSPRKGKPGSSKTKFSKDGRNVGNGRRVWIPSRADVVDRLDREGLLPAIVFVFSRVGCDAAVQQCLSAGVRLTSGEERDTIHAYVEAACHDLPEEDLHVLRYHDFLDGLTRGIAAHHAGMLPAFKHVVEELFVRGLCKVVFATETLALGINMPARTVVIEKLSKWNGETHADITPGEYTQLTGRAGRRGLDVEGHGVVLWQPGMNPQEVAGLASTRTYPLRSSFRPSYNMAVNLVDQYGRETSRELLEQSFAQFQADKAVVGLARQLRKAEDALQGYAEAAQCELGDFMEYAGLRRRISEIEKGASKARRADRREEAIESLRLLKRGDVIEVPTGKFAGYAVVIDNGWDAVNPRPYVVTADRQARRLALIDFPVPVTSVLNLKVPKSFNGRNPQMRRDLAAALRTRTHGLAPPPPGRKRSPRDGADEWAGGGAADREIQELRERLRAHPCHACPDREDHDRWAQRWHKLDRDAATLRRRVENRTNTVARQFDRVCDVLTALGYLEGTGKDVAVTEQGRHLMRLYSELDLVAAESLRIGLWDDLSVPELAAVLSMLVFEARRSDDASPPRVPSERVREVISETVRLWARLDALERDHHLDFLRQPDAGFAWAAFRWAEGDELDDVLNVVELAAGDFVRWMKQLLDLAGQVADAAGTGPLRETARGVVTAVRRGVVAYSALGDDD